MKRREIFQKLRADHRRVLRDVDGIGRGDRVEATAALRTLLSRLGRQFASHMAADDEQVFPALRLALPEASGAIEPLQVEHVELRALLQSLAALLDQPAGRRRDEALRVQWDDFSELLRRHIRKEEALVFHVAEQVLPPRELARIETRRFPRRVVARVRTRIASRKEARP